MLFHVIVVVVYLFVFVFLYRTDLAIGSYLDQSVVLLRYVYEVTMVASCYNYHLATNSSSLPSLPPSFPSSLPHCLPPSPSSLPYSLPPSLSPSLPLSFLQNTSLAQSSDHYDSHSLCRESHGCLYEKNLRWLQFNSVRYAAYKYCTVYDQQRYNSSVFSDVYRKCVGGGKLRVS